jgi:hypothetical protein
VEWHPRKRLIKQLQIQTPTLTVLYLLPTDDVDGNGRFSHAAPDLSLLKHTVIFPARLNHEMQQLLYEEHRVIHQLRLQNSNST